MHVGLGLTMQNIDGRISDQEVYRAELQLAALAEDAGLDSVWLSEHHFSDYQLTVQSPMLLSWLAGQTKRIKLGQMVTVLPWHDPIRVAESYAVLDHLSGGRAIVGLGRGLGRIEFDNFRVAMGESRRRFREYSEALLKALETGYMEYHGDLYEQPRAAIRPRPFSSFKGRTFAAAVSPASMELMARMGVGILVIAQKPWTTAEVELEAYRQRYVELNGFESVMTPTSPGGCATIISSDGPGRQSSTMSLTIPRSRTLRATSTTVPWPATSPSTASRSSTASWRTCRSGVRPARSPKSCSIRSVDAMPEPL
jgi:alkanesulfonate monooxygenase SsuD/methylene tetrahydromethanopterin reductase-like flavin-dependent oxidoreductase (luciferase family)